MLSREMFSKAKISPRCVHLFLLIVTSARHISSSQIYSANADFNITLVEFPFGPTFSTRQIYQFELVASEFFHDAVNELLQIQDRKFAAIDVTVNVKDQKVIPLKAENIEGSFHPDIFRATTPIGQKGTSLFAHCFPSTLSLSYVGHEKLPNGTEIISQVFRGEKDILLWKLQKSGLVSSTAAITLSSEGFHTEYGNLTVGEPNNEARESRVDEMKNYHLLLMGKNVVVITLLSLGCLTFFLSLIIILISFMKYSKPIEKTEKLVIPVSTIENGGLVHYGLGVCPRIEEKKIDREFIITPERGIYRSTDPYSMTPGSAMSVTSDITPTAAKTPVPLGIMSINKLVNFKSPDVKRKFPLQKTKSRLF